MTQKSFIPFILLGFVFLLGCADRQPLGGTVTFSDNGEPVPFGVVEFSTDTFRADGAIQSDGTYIIGTDTLTDGIPKGMYSILVRVDEDETIQRPDGTLNSITRSLIHTKYNNPMTSGLTHEVDGSRTARTFDIQVYRAP
ncbi:MAG: hypothetical protein FWG73_05900 [Planctomycetaceae bacterium]|nr:hypothetical protein [Planctomycetaceae bacterium]